ncbi:helix-turn-helix domain-containing protein [Candidatus Clostridium stratigraminis]|uniref:Helix-turn-helix domain-containing protein n=1 Tax=Candidatus Clostridium stratigraminis TaxID=3381661 RepID=A0ABW8T2V2_9CLOT
MNFGEKLQCLRKTKNMSQEQFAAQLSVSRQAVSKWELGESLPDTDKILLISKILGVTTDYLLNKEIDNKVFEKALTDNKSELTVNFVSKLIKKKGYLAGYIFSCYSALFFLMSRFAHFSFKKILTPPEGFDITISDLPTQMKLPLYLTNTISIIATITFAAGIIFAVYFKKKNNK